MDIREIDRMIKKAKLWIQINRGPTESKQEHKKSQQKEQEEQFWVDSNGNVLPLPEGVYRDYGQDCFRLKKDRK